jgi:hypothetical protein
MFRFSSLCLVLALVALNCTTARAQDPIVAAPEIALHEVRFRFERTPWRSVLDWIADEAGLALYVGDTPTGSFTYDDTRSYTVDEAINRLNIFLIPKRYALVRSARLLTVISLDDERSVRQLDTMARRVPIEQLGELELHDVVKCLFPLGDINVDLALQELGGLLLIRDPVALRNTNQLMVTETAGKMLMVKSVIERLTKPDLASGPVKQFPLGELEAERVLAQVRPHVGLDPLAMIGLEISLSIDIEGNQLLATGSKDKLDAVAGVMELLKSTDAMPDREQPNFKPHDLGEADLQTVVNVLETLLADEDVRLAPDSDPISLPCWDRTACMRSLTRRSSK